MPASTFRSPVRKRVSATLLGIALADLVLAVVFSNGLRLGLAAFWVAVAAGAWLRHTVVLTDEAVRVRRLLRWREVPWASVVEIPQRGRWQPHWELVLRDGSRVELTGLPDDAVPELRARWAQRN